MHRILVLTLLLVACSTPPSATVDAATGDAAVGPADAGAPLDGGADAGSLVRYGIVEITVEDTVAYVFATFRTGTADDAANLDAFDTQVVARAGACELVTFGVPSPVGQSAGVLTVAGAMDVLSLEIDRTSRNYTTTGLAENFPSGSRAHVRATGALVPAFDLDLTMPSATTSIEVSDAPPRADLPITWTPTSAERVHLVAYLDTSLTRAIRCDARGQDGTLVIPYSLVDMSGTSVLLPTLSFVAQTTIQTDGYPITGAASRQYALPSIYF